MLSSVSSHKQLFGIMSVIAALGWAFLRVGPQTTSGIGGDAARAFQWPNPDLDVLQSYTRTSPTGALIYQALHIESASLYFWLHLVAALCAISLIALWSYTSVDRASAFRAARISLLGPAAASLFISLGNYDPFTLLGIGALLFAWSRSSTVLLLLAGLYLGFQHFEQGIFAVLILALGVLGLRTVLPPRLQGLKTPLWAILGVLAGKALLSLYFTSIGISAIAGRSAYISDTSLTRLAVKESINNFPTLLTSLFAGTWIIVIITIVLLKKSNHRIHLLLALMLGLFVSVITLDQTRVFVLMTVALLSVMLVVVLTNRSSTSSPILIVGVEAMAWLVLPQSLFISPSQGAYILDTNALDYFIILVHQIPGLAQRFGIQGVTSASIQSPVLGPIA